MTDSQKTKEQFIGGLGEIGQQIAGLESLVIENKRMEDELNRYREQRRELVEELPAREGLSLNLGFLPKLKPPIRKIRVTLKEAAMTKGELLAVN